MLSCKSMKIYIYYNRMEYACSSFPFPLVWNQGPPKGDPPKSSVVATPDGSPLEGIG